MRPAARGASRTGLWAAVAALLCGALTTGCIPRVPKQVLAARAPIAVGYVVDPTHAGDAAAAPDALKAQVKAELASHNLDVVEVPLEALKGQRLSDARFAALKAARPDAAFLLLVELRVHFFSQLDGRYRWEVAATLTAARGDGQQAREPFEVPVVLMYDHEKGPEAMASAAPDIANRVGALMDGLLAGYAPGAATAPAERAVPVAARPGPNAIYFVMIDRFANGDRSNDGDADPTDPAAFHGGDLAGLTARLDWLEQLGVDTVWLSPVFKAKTAKWFGHGAFHGYWTWDLGAVEPRFGDEAALEKLSLELRRRGMRLVLDLVLNHVGPDAPLLTAHPDWFHKKGGVTNWADAEQLVSHDVHGLPDLAQEKPEVYAYLLAGARRWL